MNTVTVHYALGADGLLYLEYVESLELFTTEMQEHTPDVVVYTKQVPIEGHDYTSDDIYIALAAHIQ